MSLLAALFIIFTTLSMGVTERVRQFAVMRAVGLTRGQVARVIAVEGIMLALIGWGGGLLAGWGLLAVVSQHADRPVPQRRIAGHVVHRAHRPQRVRRRAGGVDPAGLAGHERAAAGSHVAAPLGASEPASGPSALGIAGLALIAVNPILVYVASASMSSDMLYGIYMAVGCTTMAVGFLLLTPATILIVEGVIRAGGRPAAWAWSRGCSARNSAATCGARSAPPRR